MYPCDSVNRAVNLENSAPVRGTWSLPTLPMPPEAKERRADSPLMHESTWTCLYGMVVGEKLQYESSRMTDWAAVEGLIRADNQTGP